MQYEPIINFLEISTLAYKSRYGIGMAMMLEEVTSENSVLIEEFYLLGYNAVWSVESQPTIQKNISAPSSGSKNKPTRNQKDVGTTCHEFRTGESVPGRDSNTVRPEWEPDAFSLTTSTFLFMLCTLICY
jgi:hypothetical protein